MKETFKLILCMLLLSVMLVGYAGAESSDSETITQKYFHEIDEKDYVDQNNFKLNVPDTIKKYNLLIVDPETFKKDADNGKMTVQLADKSFDLAFEPGIFVSEGDKEIVVNETGTYEVDVPEVYTYNGNVADNPESKVRFTVSDDAILGWIQVDGIKYIVSQAGYFETKDKKTVLHIVYRNIDKEITGVPPGSDDVVIVPYNNSIVSRVELATVSTRSTTTIDLLAVYDTEFRNEFPSPGTEIYNMIADVNDAYGASDIGVNLDIECYYYDSDLSSTSAANLLPEFQSENSALRNSEDCDLAFLFSGKDFTDTPIGKSYQYTGYATEGYAIAQMVNEAGTTYDGTFDERCILVAHETGHNLGAHHQTNTSPDYARAYNWKYLNYYNRYTSMWTPFTGIGTLSGMQLEFSSDSNHGDSTHDNARRISETKSTVANFQ